jgi:hypothetical protein
MNSFRPDSVPTGLVPAKSFRAASGVSETGLRALIDRGRIPEPIRLDGRCYSRPEPVSFHAAPRHRRYS